MPGRTANAGTPIEPSIVARAVEGVRYVLTGKSPNGWFGPSQPLAPMAQKEAAGRQFDYPVGYNVRLTPRSEEAISFAQLRSLADSCDLVRLAIETRKDQLCRMEWGVKPVDAKAKPDDRCKAIEDLLKSPDREHDWNGWLRMVLEDMFVIDAATVYPRMTRGGGVYSLDPMDGATIKRVLSVDGRTPMAPDPAYQQIIKGLPAVDYSRDEILYFVANPRTNRVYGYSQVEQIVMTINIAMRRQISQLDYYTAGNIPDAIYTVPDGWSPQQIKDFQTYWDALLEGNSEARRKAKFVPGGIKLEETRNPKLKDEYDEWLSRVVCYAFSLSPTAFVKQVNRATAEVAANSADEEGIAPTLQWVKRLMDQAIHRWFAMPDLQFSWKEEEATSPKEQAEISKIYVDAKVLHPDEIREDLGRDPLTPEQKADLNPPLPEEGAVPGEPGKKAPKSGAAAKDDADKVLKKKAPPLSTETVRRSRFQGTHSRAY